MTRHQLEAILLDLDGTLWDNAIFEIRVLSDVLDAAIARGLRTTKEQALSFLASIRKENPNATNHIDKLVNHFNGWEDPSVIGPAVSAYHNAKTSMHPYNGVVGVLHELQQEYCTRKRHGLGVLSTGIPKKQWDKLCRLGLTPFFTVYDREGKVTGNTVYASDTLGEKKPYPHLFETAQQKMNFSYEHTVMVGDRLDSDIAPAKLLGMCTVHIAIGKYVDQTPESARDKYMQACPGFEEPPRAAFSPDYRISNFAQLPEAIRRIERRLRGDAGGSFPTPAQTSLFQTNT